MKVYTFTLMYPWDKCGYKPYTEFHLSMDECGFLMHIIVHENNPRRTETEHQCDVYMDSCVEWFVNFCPKHSDRYFNFEVNANGAMHAAFRKNRNTAELLSIEEISELEIRTVIGEDVWEVYYHVPVTLISKYVPMYRHEKQMTIQTNFYKCGDATECPHYGIWAEIPVEEPDFHRPEYFRDLYIEEK